MAGSRAASRSRGRFLPPIWVGGLAAALLIVALVTVALLTLLPPAFVADTISSEALRRLSAEAAIRATILQTIGGLVVLIGLCLTARTVYLTRETHLTDRLTKAVDQLGHERPEVRVGGVYALQRLANNSPIDRTMITNILRGYLVARAARTTQRPAPVAPIAPDIQTALDVIVELHA